MSVLDRGKKQYMFLLFNHLVNSRTTTMISEILEPFPSLQIKSRYKIYCYLDFDCYFTTLIIIILYYYILLISQHKCLKHCL